jgi:hypothetical protein
MRSYHEPSSPGRNPRLSEEINLEEQSPGEDRAIRPEIAPVYRNEIDLESASEKRPNSDFKVAETSSISSPQQNAIGQEIRDEEEEHSSGFVTRYWRRYRIFGDALLWSLLTAYINKLVRYF